MISTILLLTIGIVLGALVVLAGIWIWNLMVRGTTPFARKDEELVLKSEMKYQIGTYVTTLVFALAALFGTAGLALVNSIAKETARTAAIELKAQDVAAKLASDPEFVATANRNLKTMLQYSVGFFTKPCVDLKEWSEYDIADGRFIVAAGRGKDAAGNDIEFRAGSTKTSIASLYKNSLKLEQMHPHDHDVGTIRIAPTGNTNLTVRDYNADGGLEIPYFEAGSSNAVEGRSPKIVFHRGGNQKGGVDPITNIPPFIALYVCRHRMPEEN